MYAGTTTWRKGRGLGGERHALGAGHAHDADCVANLGDFAHGEGPFARAQEVLPCCYSVCLAGEFRPVKERGRRKVSIMLATYRVCITEFGDEIEGHTRANVSDGIEKGLATAKEGMEKVG